MKRRDMNNKIITNMLQQNGEKQVKLKSQQNKYICRFINDQVKQFSSKYGISFNKLIKHLVKTWENMITASNKKSIFLWK